jgi:hypothetical protein
MKKDRRTLLKQLGAMLAGVALPAVAPQAAEPPFPLKKSAADWM